MSAKPESIKSPPYVSFKTFINSINKLGEHGIPNRIDPSVLNGQSGSTIAALLGAFKYLGFMDDAGTPDSSLRSFADADADGRAEILKPLLVEKYPFVTQGDFDLAHATSQQVEKAFRDQGINGSTVTKSVGFFLAAAHMAGLSTSNYVKKAKGPKVGFGGAPKPRKKRGSLSRKPDEVQLPPAPPAAQSPSQLLLAKFPNFDPEWSDALKASWFESFGTLQKMMGTETGKDDR